MRYSNVFKESLLQKFNGQMNAMVNLGYDVWYIRWDGINFYLVNINTGLQKFMFRAKAMKQSVYYHSFYYIDLFNIARKVIEEYKFDYIYVRMMPMFKSAKNFMKRCNSENIKVVLEIPTYNYGEEQKEEKRLFVKVGTLVTNYYRKKINEYISLYTIIGRKEEGEFNGKSAININNGIDLSQVPQKQTFDLKEGCLQLIGVASMRFWHGYDRVIRGLAQYHNRTAIRIHLVGPDCDGSLHAWESLIRKYNLENEIVIHGPIYGKKLDELFECCHIGLGSLGLFRIQMENGAVLKLREYMARGIPFIYSGKDPSISKDFPYALHVSNSDEALDFEEIVSFVRQIQKKKDVPQKMRNYAYENMSWEKEFSKIMEVLDKIE